MPSPIARAMSHRFAVAAEPFGVRTSDGVDLVGTRLGGAEPALVVCHGFSGWHRKVRPARFAEVLSRWFSVYGFDFRGHGLSGGETTFGAREIHDVAAVLALAREDGHASVGTLGASMGGVSVIRHAALLGATGTVPTPSAAWPSSPGPLGGAGWGGPWACGSPRSSSGLRRPRTSWARSRRRRCSSCTAGTTTSSTRRRPGGCTGGPGDPRACGWPRGSATGKTGSPTTWRSGPPAGCTPRGNCRGPGEAVRRAAGDGRAVPPGRGRLHGGRRGPGPRGEVRSSVRGDRSRRLGGGGRGAGRLRPRAGRRRGGGAAAAGLGRG